MKSKKFLSVLALAVFVIPLLTACGGPSQVDAALTSYAIALDTDSVKAGDVIFHVHNDATDLTHEMVIFKTDLPPDQLPLTDEGIVDEEGAGITFIDEVEDVEPGMSVDLAVTLEAGNYVILCNVDSDQLHYQHGMYVAFTVK